MARGRVEITSIMHVNVLCNSTLDSKRDLSFSSPKFYRTCLDRVFTLQMTHCMPLVLTLISTCWVFEKYARPQVYLSILIQHAPRLSRKTLFYPTFFIHLNMLCRAHTHTPTHTHTMRSLPYGLFPFSAFGNCVKLKNSGMSFSFESFKSLVAETFYNGV